MVDPIIEELLKQCMRSTAKFAKFFLADRFSRPFCKVHEEIFKIVDDDSIQKAAIAVFRGAGKSSICEVAVPMKHILFRSKNFIIPISASEKLALLHSNNLKDELKANQWVHKLFPPIDTSDHWAQTGWKAFDTFVMPRGRGQQIRGALVGKSRPDLFIIDDLENPDEITSEDYRDKTRSYFINDVMNSVDRGSKDWRILLLCTISHEDCLFEHLATQPDWTTLRLGILDDAGESVWPEFMSTEDVRALEEFYRREGKLDWFYREYQNIPIVPSFGFSGSMFKYYEKEEQDINSNPDYETAIIVDPARTMEEGSAHTAIVAVTINSAKDEILIRDVVDDVMDPKTLLDESFAMLERCNATAIAPEITGSESFIMYLYQSELIRRKKPYISLVPIKPRDEKAKRAGALIPLYKQGIVWHNREKCRALEQQMLSFPKPRRWDMLDAVAHLIPVFYSGDRYSPPDNDPNPGGMSDEELRQWLDSELEAIDFGV